MTQYQYSGPLYEEAKRKQEEADKLQSAAAKAAVMQQQAQQSSCQHEYVNMSCYGGNLKVCTKCNKIT